MTVTPDDVRNAAFDKPPLGRRGYATDDVDELLDRVEEALSGATTMTVDEVRTVKFGTGTLTKRGYDEDQVDAFLERVVAALAALGRPPAP